MPQNRDTNAQSKPPPVRGIFFLKDDQNHLLNRHQICYFHAKNYFVVVIIKVIKVMM
jgi:hypothetical protein